MHVSLIRSRPSITSVNRIRSVSRSGRCGAISDVAEETGLEVRAQGTWQ